MVVQCTIEFENNNITTFYGGQTINGVVLIYTNKPKKLNGIALKVKGVAKTNWSESSTDSDNNSTSTYYSGKVIYLDTYNLLREANSDGFMLKTGIQRFTFTTHLPEKCPSSYESKHCNVRYDLIVSLLIPWAIDKTFTKRFTVLKRYDLNYEPILASPVYTEVKKKFGIAIFKSGPLIIKLDLPQSGFVPGQKIPVRIGIQNQSGISVQKLKPCLVLEATLHPDKPTKKSYLERTIVTKLPDIAAVGNSITCEIPVPPGPPTDMELCRIIKINYFVEVKAKMPGLYTNQVARVPIKIGTVPLRIGFQRHLTTQPNQNRHDKDDPPPSYMEAVYMPPAVVNLNGERNCGDTDFHPRYPVYYTPTPTIVGRFES